MLGGLERAGIAPMRPAACAPLATPADGRGRASEGEDLIVVWRDGLRISAGPGPIFGSDDNLPTPVSSSTLAAIVDSLAPVPTDDPRLTKHALDEDTVDHP